MAEHLEEVFDSRRQPGRWAATPPGPITSLRAMLEAIEDGVVEPTHYLGALQSQVRLLAAMVDDLFELACIDAGATALEVEDVDMWPCSPRACTAFELEADAKGVRIIPVLRDRLATARCAPDKVERVLANLVTNSLRYTPVGGTITLSSPGRARRTARHRSMLRGAMPARCPPRDEDTAAPRVRERVMVPRPGCSGASWSPGWRGRAPPCRGTTRRGEAVAQHRDDAHPLASASSSKRCMHE